jgi:hypothetical protein
MDGFQKFHSRVVGKVLYVVQFHPFQDMVFHDKPDWMNTWVIRDRPKILSPPIACYER